MSYIDSRKLFVGGIGLSTTESTLYDYFSKFGMVTSCKVMVNIKTEKSRGFAFVTFNDANSANLVLAQKNHFLKGKKIDPKLAFAKEVPVTQIYNYQEPSFNCNNMVYEGEFNDDPYNNCRRVFVGGIGNTTEKQLWDHFSVFGAVKAISIMLHKTTRRPRGFAFVEFESYESALNSINSRYQTINDKTIEVQIAVPKYMIENIKHTNKIVNNLLKNDSMSPSFEEFTDASGTKTLYRDKEDIRFLECMTDDPKDSLNAYNNMVDCSNNQNYLSIGCRKYAPGSHFFNHSDDQSEENSFSPKEMNQSVLDEYGFPDDTKSSIYEILDEILNGH